MMTMYNVVCAHSPKLLMALRAMTDINTDIALLVEMKLCDEWYTKKGHGYTVFATQAPSTQQGSIALVWQTARTQWTLEGMRAVMVNVISATLVSGTHRWLVIGTYLPPCLRPDNELTAIEAEYQHTPWLPVIWLGDFNVYLEDDMCERAVAISTTAQHVGVVDLLHQFKQKKYRWHTFHCRQPDGLHLHSPCNYIMVDQFMDIQSLRVMNLLCYHSDHLALKIQIPSATNQAHCQYLNNQSQLPSVKVAVDEGEPNAVFTQLLTHHERPVAPTYPTHDAWITQDTWKLIDWRTAALKWNAPQEELCMLCKSIRKMICHDWDAWLQKMGDEIQAHLDANKTTEAWQLVKVWYCH